MAAAKKDNWDKAEIILKPVGALAAAATVALLGYFTSQYLQEREQIASTSQLRLELLIREDLAKLSVQKDLLSVIINEFLPDDRPNTIDEMERKIAVLTMFDSYFEDVLYITPLFKLVKSDIARLENRQDAEDSSLAGVVTKMGRAVGVPVPDVLRVPLSN